MAAHKWVFGLSLLLSFLGLLVQVQIPSLMGRAINLAIESHVARLSGYVQWIVLLAVVRGVMTYGSRLCLLRTAYDVEYDLRTIIYEHLTGCHSPSMTRCWSAGSRTGWTPSSMNAASRCRPANGS